MLPSMSKCTTWRFRSDLFLFQQAACSVQAASASILLRYFSCARFVPVSEQKRLMSCGCPGPLGRRVPGYRRLAYIRRVGPGSDSEHSPGYGQPTGPTYICDTKHDRLPFDNRAARVFGIFLRDSVPKRGLESTQLCRTSISTVGRSASCLLQYHEVDVHGMVFSGIDSDPAAVLPGAWVHNSMSSCALKSTLSDCFLLKWPSTLIHYFSYNA